MDFKEIVALIKSEFGDESIVHTAQEDGLMPFVEVYQEKLLPIAQFLYTDPRCFFDYLACITGMDNGPDKNSMEVIYNLYSIPFETKFCFKVVLARNTAGNLLPEIHTLSHIWRTANWHEREIFDLFGIYFINHPDLRRILLPADWEGYPLRKDYNLQTYYHDIKVAY
jgi:NADH-quinone oxidoreductase subunit C